MTATNICYNFVGFRCSPPLLIKEILPGDELSSNHMTIATELM